MATHSSTLAWKVPWAEEPGRLQSIGLQRVRHDWSNLACTKAAFIYFSSGIKQKLSESIILNFKRIFRENYSVCVCVCVCVCLHTVLDENVKCISNCALWWKKMKLRWHELQSRIFAARWKRVEHERGSYSLSFFWEGELQSELLLAWATWTPKWPSGRPTGVKGSWFRAADKGSHSTGVQNC